MLNLYFLIIGFFGWRPKETGKVPQTSPPPGRVVRPIALWKSIAQLAREAIDLLDRAEHGHRYGTVPPSKEKVAQAWEALERIDLALAGFIRTCIALAISVPVCQRGYDVNQWFTDTRCAADQSVEDVITAIWQHMAVKSWPGLDDVLARDVTSRLKGPPTVIRLDGPEAKREVHVRDSVRSNEHPQGRPIIARLYEFGKGGRLRILEQGGGWLSRETVDRSDWTICDGWIASVPGAFGGRGQLPNAGADENTPPPAFKL
jgi:hypothetical protein